MQARKSFLSAVLSVITIPAVIVVILLDKPDYSLFDFIHRNIVPAAEIVGQAVTYPVRLIARTAENVAKRKETLMENDEIIATLEKLEKAKLEKEILEKENELLKSKLNMAGEIRQKVVAGKIVHDNSFMENQSFVLGGPSEISRGNIVISNSGHMLGLVVEKAGGYAKVRSLKDSASNIPVRIAGTDVFGFLQGAGNSAPELRFLSNGDFAVEPGMLLLTSGVNGNLPDNIPVGTVESVRNSDIKVRLGRELKRQESVMVLLFDGNGKYE